MNLYRITTLSLLLVGLAQLTSAQSPGPSEKTVTIHPRTGTSPVGNPTFLDYQNVQRPGVAVILSGGGARGLSSIGVLRVLEENDIPIDLIVGTSIGSIVGGLYASGYSPDQLEDIALTTDWSEVLSYDDDARRKDMFLDRKLATDKSIMVLRFDGFEPVIPGAYSTGQRLTNFLNLLVVQGIYRPDPSFDDLRIPFRAVTTDLVSGKQYVFREGDLSEALRASAAVPLLFSSVQKDSMQLLDGGLISNMPVDVARDEGIEFVIVVDVTSPLRSASQVVAPWEVGEQIIGIMMQRANEEARQKADVVITPALGDHLSSDFTDIDSLIEAGETAARALLADIRKRLEVTPERDGGFVLLPSHLDFSDADLYAGDMRFSQQRLRQVPVTLQTIQLLVDDLHATGSYADIHVQVVPDTVAPALKLSATRFPVLEDIRFVGARAFSADTLQAPFRDLIGRHLNALELRNRFDELIAMYRSRGFSLAHVDRAEFDETTGVASVQLDEGIISRMTIRGTEKTRDYVVWRELPFRDGDIFEVSKVAEGLLNIYSTNLFEQASVALEHEDNDTEVHVLVFNLRERATELIRIGMRVDNERSFQPWIHIMDENFLGAGAELGVSFSGGTRNQSVIGELRAFRIFDSYLTSQLQVYMRSKDVNMYGYVPGLPLDRFERTRVGEIREIRRGGSLSFGAQLDRLGDFTVKGRLERIQVYNILNQPITNQDYNISSISFGTRVDTRDKVPFPTDGVNLQFSYETALVNALNSVGFTKFLFSYESFRTYAGSHSLLARVMLGLGDDAVPTSEQFSLGGQESFFGYREDNDRGRQIVVGGLEYRYRLPFRILFDTYASIRYDVGSVWLRAEEIRLVDLRHGVGLTLGFDTPIGPATFGVGRSFVIRGDLLDKPLALGATQGYFRIGIPLN